MFVESKTDATVKEGWFDRLGRRHPLVFTAFLVVLTIAVTIGLLMKPTYTLVLYQGF